MADSVAFNPTLKKRIFFTEIKYVFMYNRKATIRPKLKFEH